MNLVWGSGENTPTCNVASEGVIRSVGLLLLLRIVLSIIKLTGLAVVYTLLSLPVLLCWESLSNFLSIEFEGFFLIPIAPKN